MQRKQFIGLVNMFDYVNLKMFLMLLYFVTEIHSWCTLPVPCSPDHLVPLQLEGGVVLNISQGFSCCTVGHFVWAII